jgi:hypothetical protein
VFLGSCAPLPKQKNRSFTEKNYFTYLIPHVCHNISINDLEKHQRNIDIARKKPKSLCAIPTG